MFFSPGVSPWYWYVSRYYIYVWNLLLSGTEGLQMFLLRNTRNCLSPRLAVHILLLLWSIVVYSWTMSSPLCRIGLWKSSRMVLVQPWLVRPSITFSIRNCKTTSFESPIPLTLENRFELLLRFKANYLWPGARTESVFWTWYWRRIWCASAQWSRWVREQLVFQVVEST